MPFGRSKDEDFLSVDIGTSAIKVMQLQLGAEKPKLLNVCSCPTPSGVFSNNQITKAEEVSSAINDLLNANQIRTKKTVTAVPGPSAFTKKITINYSDIRHLQQNIGFEAANYIPHNIDAVKLDFQVVKTNGKSSMDVFLVAVKNEIVNSFITTIEGAGLELAVLDVDYFALENMFELNYPEYQNKTLDKNKTIALLDIGSKFSSVLLMQDGETLFYGDVGVGGRLYTEALCQTLQMKPREAEQAKLGKFDEKYDVNIINETIERTTDHIVSELHRQLGYFWNTAATNRNIDVIYVGGGSAKMKGLVEELAHKTNTPCNILNPFKNINCENNLSQDSIQELAPTMAVSVGLALRRVGDKRHVIE